MIGFIYQKRNAIFTTKVITFLPIVILQGFTPEPF